MYLTVIASLFVACRSVNDQPLKTPVIQTTNIYKAEVYQDGTLGFGFNISQSGITVIDQPTIPAIAQNKAFASRQDAMQVSLLMKQKLDGGIFPPAVTIDELDSMHIRY